MEIRFLTSDDASEWWRLRAEALAGDPEAFSSSSEEHSRITLDEVKGRLGSGRDSFVVGALEDGRLIGMAGFHRETGPKTRHKGRIWGVYVTPAKRGDGTGVCCGNCWIGLGRSKGWSRLCSQSQRRRLRQSSYIAL
jgi:GNAT superfamily N-acetyltransferase